MTMKQQEQKNDSANITNVDKQITAHHHFVQIRCKNTQETLNINMGSQLSDIFAQLGLNMEYGPIIARVNNRACHPDFMGS